MNNKKGIKIILILKSKSFTISLSKVSDMIINKNPAINIINLNF